MTSLEMGKMSAISRRTVLKGGVLAAAALAVHQASWASAKTASIPQVRRNNGVMMPALGFGTYGLRSETSPCGHYWLK